MFVQDAEGLLSKKSAWKAGAAQGFPVSDIRRHDLGLRASWVAGCG